MKKIPTLFERVYENHRIVDILDKVIPGCEQAFQHGKATIKIDGACSAVIGGEFYKRFDVKKGKTPPEGAIPCCDPDPITGHWPHWVKVDQNNPGDKWFVKAYTDYSQGKVIPDGTYEVAGPHFQGNPQEYGCDILVRHGSVVPDHPITRTFQGVKDYLEHHNIEGLVFWLDGEPVCKIKRSDFGLEWPVKNLQEKVLD